MLANHDGKQEPKVSIIIPVYNGFEYMKYAIDSALKQTYSNIEILVIDDGSNDNGKTKEIALSYGDKIRYFRKDNGGVSSALNYGIKEMTGEYFSWLSHDDVYSETKVEDSIEILRKYNQISKKTIAYTDGMFIDSNGNDLYPLKKFFEKDKIYSGMNVVEIMTKKGTLNGCCMLIPKVAFTEVCLFDEKLRYSQDSLMWYSLFLKGYSLVSDGKLNVMNRVHAKQVTHTRRDLYEHDALVIAKKLAEPLANEGTDIFLNYLYRQLKHQCTTTIAYLLKFAKQKKIFSRRQKIRLYFYMIAGKIRYTMAKVYKRILLIIRNGRKDK